MEIKKVYFFYIIKCNVEVYKEYAEYSDSCELSISGTEVISKSKNYSTVEEALDAQDKMKDEKHYYYDYSPVMEGWIRE